ncbi:MAG: NTP transferase domain-containing protein [Nitrospirae bacterium]|nr:NTP transferase domain-containing protein [Nitrospirota bacterium]
MMSLSNPSGQLWSIILAGGEGTRLSSLVHRWLGRPKPKQYCAFVGTRSMFQHTLDRAARLTPPDRMVTVVARPSPGSARAAGRQAGEHDSLPADQSRHSGRPVLAADLYPRQGSAGHRGALPIGPFRVSRRAVLRSSPTCGPDRGITTRPVGDVGRPP